MAKARSEYYTRTRFLNQLGLFQEPLPKISAAATTSTTTTTTTTTNRAVGDGSCSSGECQPHPTGASIHGNVMVPFEIKLNDSWQQSTYMSPTSCHSSFTSDDSMESCEPQQPQQQQQQQYHIHFKDTVSVIPIPSRHQYSDRIKQRIWSNRLELREMAQRNMIEFESEGYDWRNVVLEEDMYIDACNGNYIHPCHVNHSYYFPQQLSTVGGGGGGATAGSLQEVLGANNDEDETDDDHYHFAPLRRLDSTVMA